MVNEKCHDLNKLLKYENKSINDKDLPVLTFLVFFIASVNAQTVSQKRKIKLPNDGNVKIIDSSKQEIPFSKVADKTIQFSTMKSGKYVINMENNQAHYQ